MLETLAYASNALVPAHSAEMLDIARACLRNNPRLGVTGALYFDGRQFYQVLEGDETVLACLFDAIRSDPRHTDVKMVYRRPIRERRFGDWSMKFIDGSGDPELRPHFDYAEAVKPELHAQDARIEALTAA